MGIDLRQKAANFPFANGHVTVAEEEVNRALDLHLEARFMAQFDPLGEPGTLDSRLGVLVDLAIELAGNDASASVGLQSLGDPKRADTAKGSRLHHQFRLNGGDDGAQELEHLGLGGHGIEHVPAFRMRTLGSRPMIFGLQLIAATLDLSQDAAFLLFFFEKAAKAERHRVKKCTAERRESRPRLSGGAKPPPATVFGSSLIKKDLRALHSRGQPRAAVPTPYSLVK